MGSGHRARIAKNTGVYFFAAILPEVVKMAMLPVYSRLLTPAEFGLVALVNSFSVFTGTLAGMQMSAGLLVHFFEYDYQVRKTYVSSLLWTKLMVLALFVGLLQPFGDIIVRGLFPKSGVSYFPLFFLGFITMAMREQGSVPRMVLRAQERAVASGGAAVFTALLLPLCEVALMLKGPSRLEGLFYGRFLALVLGQFLLLFLCRKMIVFRVDWSLVRRNLAFSLPLVPHAIGGFLFNLSDRFVLEKFVSLGELGLYAMADRISMGFRHLVDAMHNAVNPNFMRIAHKDKKRAVRLVRENATLYVFATLWIMSVISVFSQEMLVVLSTPKFAGAWRFIPVLLLAYWFRGMYRFPVKALMFSKRTGLIAVTTLTAGIVNIGLNFLLVPLFGAMAAAGTTVFSFALTFLGAQVFAYRHMDLTFETGRILFLCALFMGLVFVALLVQLSSVYMAMAFKVMLLSLPVIVVSRLGWVDILGEIRALAASRKLHDTTKQ